MTVLDQRLDHAPGDVRDTARDLLSRPPYQEEAEDLLTRAVGTMREWLAELVDRLVGVVAGDTTLAWVVVGVGLVLLLLVVWRSARGMTVDTAVEVAAAGGGQGRDAASWLAEADEHQDAGRFEEAVRCRYVGLVVALVEAGVVEEVPGRTVGDLDRELVATAPELAEHAAHAGAIFAAVVYGGRGADAARSARIQELVDQARPRTKRSVAAASYG